MSPEWLARHAPVTHATLNPPATATAIAAAEREIGYPFPAELVTWWLANDGVRSGPVGMILPGYAPMPISDVLDVVDLLLSSDYEPPEAPGEIDHGRAGEPTRWFLPQMS